MDKDIFEGIWKLVKGKIKEQWGKLSDDDIDVSMAKGNNFWAESRSVMAWPMTPRKSGERVREAAGRDGGPLQKLPLDLQGAPTETSRPPLLILTSGDQSL